MRWPLLGFFFIIIWLEFSAYVLTRQIVNVFEYSVAWWGHKAKLRLEMRKSKTYDEWKGAARKLDRYLGFDEWKETDDDPYFDYILVGLTSAPTFNPNVGLQADEIRSSVSDEL